MIDLRRFVKRYSTGLHRSTVVLTVLMALLLMLPNVTERFVLIPDVLRDGKYGPHFEFDAESRYGWPCTFLTGEPSLRDTSPYWRLSFFNASEDGRVFSLHALAANVGCGLGLLALCGALFEWRRRRLASAFQIRLLDVVVIISVASVALAYVRSLHSRQRSEKQIVNAIRELGYFNDARWQPVGALRLREWLGRQADRVPEYVVGIDVEGGGLSYAIRLNSLRMLRISGSITNDQLAILREIPELEALDMCFVSIVSEAEWTEESADNFVHLPRLPHLRGLNLYDTSFRGDGLDNIPNIENLDVSDTDLDDIAMPQLGRLMRLKHLSLVGTSITDESLQHLATLPQLKELNLGYTQISDDGLRRLWSLKSLEYLGLYNTRVTDAGVNALRKHLPDCEVYK